MTQTPAKDLDPGTRVVHKGNVLTLTRRYGHADHETGWYTSDPGGQPGHTVSDRALDKNWEVIDDLPLYWGEVVDAGDDFVVIALAEGNHSTGVVGSHVKVFTDTSVDAEREAKIMRVAQAIHESDLGGKKAILAWSELSGTAKDTYRKRAAAAIDVLEADGPGGGGYPMTATNERLPFYTPCVCEHPPWVHRGVIIPVEGEPKADYASALGSCQSCSCDRYAPRDSGSEATR